jgi:hypothetical protein
MGGPNGCLRDHLPRRCRAFSPPHPAPVLAGVKVARPVGRSTLTPAAAGVMKPIPEGRDPSALDTARPHGCDEQPDTGHDDGAPHGGGVPAHPSVVQRRWREGGHRGSVADRIAVCHGAPGGQVTPGSTGVSGHGPAIALMPGWRTEASERITVGKDLIGGVSQAGTCSASRPGVGFGARPSQAASFRPGRARRIAAVATSGRAANDRVADGVLSPPVGRLHLGLGQGR